jgi:geranylgeranyl reductase family protein
MGEGGPPDTLAADVLVVGAGPAGCAAAIGLARAGRDVLLVDRARFPRDKTCGDGLTTGALYRLEELGLDPADVASFTPARELALRSPSGRVATLPLGDGSGVPAAVARRGDLDARLLDLARAAGARVLEARAFRALSPSGGLLEAALDGGLTARAPYLVAADGARSAVRRALGRDATAGRPEQGWLAFRAYARDVAPEAAGQWWVWFDEALLPGYGWSFPVGAASVNLGVCAPLGPGRRGRDLAAAWQRMLASPFVTSLLGARARLEAPARAWPIPARRDVSVCAADGRVLFTGDAAFAADPFTGEGIAQALETGTLAAAAIAGPGSADPAAVARRRDQTVAAACSSLMAHPRLVRAVVHGCGASRALARRVGRWLFEAYPRGIALTPSAWRPARLRRPDPYAGRALSPGWPRSAGRGR